MIENQYDKVAPGIWRAELTLQPKVRKATPYNPRKPDEQIERSTEDLQDGMLPFQFDLGYEDDGELFIDIINGEERIRATDVVFGRNLETGRDTIRIDFPLYESFIRGEVEEKFINGEYVVTTKKNYAIPFSAKHGQGYRFASTKLTPQLDMSGKWSVTFGVEGDDPYPAIGEFVQAGNHLTGTFLTETGDYRYLEGTVQGDKFFLSTFDGSHAFLFSGKILSDKSLVGSFRSGTHYRTTWTAKRDEQVKLISPDSLTYLKAGYNALTFAFPNTAGETVSLTDPAYQGKAKIIQIFGTWCPNCRDEANFLVDYLKKNRLPNLIVIGLAFEKHRDFDKASAAVARYQQRLEIPYPMLIAGYYNKKEAAEALPMLNKIISYPTMIFLDNNDKVVKIHTGFSGPATSAFADFKTDFDQTVKQITNF